MTFGEFWTYSKAPLFGTQLPGFLGSLFALVIAIIVLMIDPVSDIWYYGGCFLTFLCTLFTMAAILLKYNTIFSFHHLLLLLRHVLLLNEAVQDKVLHYCFPE